MNQELGRCDETLLDELLGGTIDDDGSRRLIDHLDSCPKCRGALDSRSTETQRETSALLRQQPFDADSEADVAISVAKPDAEYAVENSFSIRNVVDSLAPTDDPTMLGRIGGYEVSGVVGAGGMGVVLKAFDTSLDRSVAIKVLSPHLACSGAARIRFEREAKAAAAVLHPNVVAIHGVSGGDDDSSLPFLVMPYVRGASLQSRIDREGPLEVTEVLRIASQIVEGLGAAHAQGLVHRDIKPANILLEESVERVSITDFGLARAVDDATLTHSGVIAGTPQYMSPEQASGDTIDSRSDLFSLGSVIYTMCTGRPPFRAETSYGILRRISDETPRPIREIQPSIPVWLCRLVDKLHAKSPDDRYQSASDVATVLQQCLAHVQTPDARLPRELQGPSPLERIGGPRAFVAVLTTIVALIVGSFLYWQWVGQAELDQRSNADGQSERGSPLAGGSQAVPGQQAPGRESERSSEVSGPSAEELSWIESDEPSIESVRALLENLDRDTRQSFETNSNPSMNPIGR